VRPTCVMSTYSPTTYSMPCSGSDHSRHSGVGTAGTRSTYQPSQLSQPGARAWRHSRSSGSAGKVLAALPQARAPRRRWQSGTPPLWTRACLGRTQSCSRRRLQRPAQHNPRLRNMYACAHMTDSIRCTGCCSTATAAEGTGSPPEKGFDAPDAHSQKHADPPPSPGFQCWMKPSTQGGFSMGQNRHSRRPT
jgi:hypothetical protein